MFSGNSSTACKNVEVFEKKFTAAIIILKIIIHLHCHKHNLKAYLPSHISCALKIKHLIVHKKEFIEKCKDSRIQFPVETVNILFSGTVQV